MPSQQSSDVKFDIGHVLFIDIVGYSKLLIHEQSELQRQLNDVVRGHGAVSSGQEIGEIDSITEGRRNCSGFTWRPAFRTPRRIRWT